MNTPTDSRVVAASRFDVSLGVGVLARSVSTGRVRSFAAIEASFTWFAHPNLGLTLTYVAGFDREGVDGSRTLRIEQLPSVGVTARHFLVERLAVFAELAGALSIETVDQSAPLSSVSRTAPGFAVVLNGGLMLSFAAFGLRVQLNSVWSERGIAAGGSARAVVSFD